MEEKNTPTGEKILKLLVDLYAEQENLKIEYSIEGSSNEEGD